MKQGILLLLLSVTVSAQPQLTRTVYMELNDYVLFVSNQITHVPLSSHKVLGSFPCTTRTADLYINYSDYTLCACDCPSAVIGCPQPFHVSRKPFNKIDFSSPLELSDTSLFTKIDTVPNDEFTGGCALPYIIQGKGQNIPDVLVLKTTLGGYALIHMTQKIENVSCSGGGEIYTSVATLRGYTVTWHLDYSGNKKPDFTWVDHTHLQSPPDMAPPALSPARQTGSTMYTLRGRKVPVAHAARAGTCPKALFIVRTESGVRPVLR